ncbi:TPA: plasmid recombination enzyme [Salmonella enterica]|nr:plasmid recombination enzyme [Salmonella enterica]
MGAPKFVVLRTEKLKHLASVYRSLKHSFREQDTPNAAAELGHENSHFGAQSAAAAQAAIKAKLPEKRRKDAVLAIEYLVTASPEAMHSKSREQQDAYFADSLEWLKERHGAENVVYAGIHRDEKTPHMYAYVVPLDPDSGRLNAKRWLGGSKALNQMQTEFAEKVGAQHGLERGIEGSKARHQTIKKHYAAIEKGTKNHVEISPEALEPRAYKREGLAEKLRLTTRVESTEAVAARLSASVNEGFAGTIANAAESAQNARRAREMQKTMVDQQKKLKTLQEPFKGLSREQVAEVIKMATTMQRENEAAKAAKLQRQREQRQQRRSQGRGFSR